jgi:serine/threonine-protein kinase
VSTPGLLNQSVGDYRLVEFIGAGGMGEVYRAVHAKIGRVAAVKILTAAAPDSDFVQRFLNEARVHASLQHPNIATLYDFLEFNGRPCIVMEYLDGETLADRLRRGGPLDPDEAWSVFAPIVAAVAYVHDQGIVHRDLKPDNIRVTSKGVVKLLDFGIARGEQTPQFTRVGNVIGTMTYLAPEQLQGQPATVRSDVWALGILLYEILIGRVPFDAPNMPALIDKIRTGNYTKPSVARAEAEPLEEDAARRVDRIVGRCLRRNPNDRYANGRAILDDLPSAAPPGRGAQRVRVPAESLRARVAPIRERVASIRKRLEPRLERLPAPLGSADPAAALGLLARYWAYLVGAAVLVGLLVVFVLGRTPPDDGGGGRGGGAPSSDVILTTHRIEVAEGMADVYINGSLVGRTPYDYKARPHETVSIVLKQPGFADFSQTFDVTGRQIWTLTMTRNHDQD